MIINKMELNNEIKSKLNNSKMKKININNEDLYYSTKIKFNNKKKEVFK